MSPPALNKSFWGWAHLVITYCTRKQSDWGSSSSSWYSNFNCQHNARPFTYHLPSGHYLIQLMGYILHSWTHTHTRTYVYLTQNRQWTKGLQLIFIKRSFWQCSRHEHDKNTAIHINNTYSQYHEYSWVLMHSDCPMQMTFNCECEVKVFYSIN